MYHLIVKTSCPFCQDAVNFLSSKKEEGGEFDFMVTVMDYAEEELKNIQNTHSHFTVPVVLKDGVLVGGYTELVKEFNDEEVEVA